MIFGYFIFFTAALLSLVAAYYSVTGLATIFAAAAVPVIIMGGILELGKVVATVWLHTNWARAPQMFKVYLVPAVALLMLLTSMGIFGFLSKAHLDQAVPSGDIAAQVQIYDEKIQTQRDNIDAARKALKQLDESVDQLLGRSSDERGADKAVQLRRSQAKERTRLQNEIATAQKEITTLQEQRTPIASQLRQIEAEVGPIKYLAALIYGNEASHTMLENAVRWIIILIVLVFDPLALVLILAGTKQIAWAREQKEQHKGNKPDARAADVGEPPTAAELVEVNESQEPTEQGSATLAAASLEQNKVKELGLLVSELSSQQKLQLEEISQLTEKLSTKEKDLNDLLATSSAVSDEYDRVLTVLAEKTEVNKQLQNSYVNLAEEKDKLEQELIQKAKDINVLTQQIAELEAAIVELETAIAITHENNANTEAENTAPLGQLAGNDLVATNIMVVPVESSAAAAEDDTVVLPPNAAFGTKFPLNPGKGDLFLRVDYLPSRLYKWNDSKWIEIDKAVTDSYTYDEAYIKFLITKLASGDYDTDDLSESEQEQVTEYLKRTRRV